MDLAGVTKQIHLWATLDLNQSKPSVHIFYHAATLCTLARPLHVVSFFSLGWISKRSDYKSNLPWQCTEYIGKFLARPLLFTP